jgi:hypothetical protein
MGVPNGAETRCNARLWQGRNGAAVKAFWRWLGSYRGRQKRGRGRCLDNWRQGLWVLAFARTTMVFRFGRGENSPSLQYPQGPPSFARPAIIRGDRANKKPGLGVRAFWGAKASGVPRALGLIRRQRV